MNDIVYPARPPVFPLKLQKLLLREKVARTIEAAGCWLLAAVASAEDDDGCRGPVAFWNDQLAALIGGVSEPTLMRVRRKCVDAGWLRYTPRHRRDGLYFVTIPDGYSLTGKSRAGVQADILRQKDVGVKACAKHPTEETTRAGLAQAQTKETDGQRFCPPSLDPLSPSSRDTSTPVAAQVPVTRIPVNEATSPTLDIRRTPRIDEIVDHWNSHESLPRVAVKAPGLSRHLTALTAIDGFCDGWRAVIDAIARMPFYCGANNRRWTVTLDWFLKPDNFAKVANMAAAARPHPPPRQSRLVSAETLPLNDDRVYPRQEIARA